MKTKVFISCGQNENNCRERRITETLKKIVERDDQRFEAYIANEKQDGKSFRENIFNQLADSEYFLFVDLKRERLVSHPRDILKARYGGSLFCHQELAVASYLDLEPLYFCEKGLERNGLLHFIQSNAIYFSDEQQLYTMVRNAVAKWEIGWKNRLELVVAPNYPSIANITNGQPIQTEWYHIYVKNLHRSKKAFNCFAFLEKIVNLKTSEETRPKTIELHWAGFNFPSATILPKAERVLDGFVIDKRAPNILTVPSFSQSTEFHPANLYPGEYNLTYRVISQNFADAVATFRVLFEGGSTRAKLKLDDSQSFKLGCKSTAANFVAGSSTGVVSTIF